MDEKISKKLFDSNNRKGTDTKIRILKAAVNALAEDGIEKVTFESVGKRIDMNATQVRYHFTEKSLLVARAIEYVVHSYQDSVISTADGGDGDIQFIETVVKGAHKWANDNKDQRAAFLLFLYLTGNDPHYTEMHTAMFNNGNKRMVKTLTERAKKNGWSDDKLEAISLAIWSIIDGMLIYAMTTKSNYGPNYFMDKSLVAIKTLIDA